jgi:hypothetical protein
LRASDNKESVSNPKQQQLQLRIFCTDIPFTDGLSTLQVISGKFPNQEELRLGRVEEVDPDPFLSSVKSCHSELQRLIWTFFEVESEMFTLDDLCHHLLRVPELLPTLNNYCFRHDKNLFDNDNWEDDSIIQENREESAKLLLSLLPNSNSTCLVINLLMKCLSCD